jgi:uncharacterized protein
MRSALLLICGLFVLCAAANGQQNPAGLAKPETAVISDRFQLPMPSAIKLGGLLGARFSRNERNRLLRVDEQELLAGFRQRPGKQAWIGEHVGKWLHAASLAYANTGDGEMRTKLDRVVRELLKTQEPDGYLGTYTPDKRFGLYPNADWDVWVHKYDLLGLLTYYQYTGDKEALQGARRVGDLLLATFGPGKKSILSAGTHVGMASTSVLEPMVLLYRATGDKRYLEFAQYIVGSWEEPNGPRIISTLLKERSVRKTANGKAYEMISNLSGLCELYRVTGNPQYLGTALIAWEDIVRNRLYITGTGSSFEHWQDEYHLPNGKGANVGETCVTVTWEQLNIELLRLLGEARFAEQLERSVYNHLLAAQRPTGDAWCYYTSLEGDKPYGSSTNCCLSSGPRGVALLPNIVYASTPHGVAVNLFTTSSATIPLQGRDTVRIEQSTDYPLDGTVNLTVTPSGRKKEFNLLLRVPSWTQRASVKVNGKEEPVVIKAGEYATVRREWQPGDRVTYKMDLPGRLVLGDHGNAGRAAVMYGPLVLSADEADNPNARPITRLALAQDTLSTFNLKLTTPTGKADAPRFETEATLTDSSKHKLILRPFYDAGSSGSRYHVWLRRPGTVGIAGSLFAFGEETRSREGNVGGFIADDDTSTFVVTFDNTKKDADWFAVALPTPILIDRVVYAHGRTFHDGGWFDTSSGKPRIQVQRARGGSWEDVAMLDSYPSSTAEKPGSGLRDGATFTVKFPAVQAVGVRVIGKPASGDNPSQAFSSCAELQTFHDKGG